MAELVYENVAVILSKNFGYVGRFKDAGSVTTTDHIVTATKAVVTVNDYFVIRLG